MDRVNHDRCVEACVREGDPGSVPHHLPSRTDLADRSLGHGDLRVQHHDLEAPGLEDLGVVAGTPGDVQESPTRGRTEELRHEPDHRGACPPGQVVGPGFLGVVSWTRSLMAGLHETIMPSALEPKGLRTSLVHALTAIYVSPSLGGLDTHPSRE